MCTVKSTLLASIGKSSISIFSTWLGVYPLLTLLAVIFEPLLTQQNVYIRTLVMSSIMVPLMVLIIMPVINQLLSKLNITNTNQNERG